MQKGGWVQRSFAPGGKKKIRVLCARTHLRKILYTPLIIAPLSEPNTALPQININLWSIMISNGGVLICSGAVLAVIELEAMIH